MKFGPNNLGVNELLSANKAEAFLWVSITGGAQGNLTSVDNGSDSSAIVIVLEATSPLESSVFPEKVEIIF